MCGITVIVERCVSVDADGMADAVRRMTSTLIHRGPDRQATWLDTDAGVAFGHSRLAIVDLSSSGNQPMHSSDGKCVLAYNGEIYNAPALRCDLERVGHVFCGSSDTEVLLAGLCHWGVPECLRRLDGMFAFALWDRTDRRLTLARDRLGEKPLYWADFGGLLIAGSELKALRVHPRWRGEVDRSALAAYLQCRNVPGSMTIYRNVQKLLPGHMLEWCPGRDVRITRYWDPATVAARGEMDLTDEAAVDRLDALLRDAVGRRLVADVPLGGFLSGGIDSSLVTALMQAESSSPVRTFSIGFEKSDFDEAPYARAVAGYLGTDHTELYVGADDALDLVPRLPEIYDEPFADASQIPTCLLAALTRRHVTVALSGDGGDELFAGYRRYQEAEQAWSRIDRLPMAWRQLAGRGLGVLIHGLQHTTVGRGIAGRQGILPLERLQYWAAIASAPDARNFYAHRTAQWREAAMDDQGASLDPMLTADFGGNGMDFLSAMQLSDLNSYLPDDILVKVDRASMAVALEARVPLLDVNVVEFALGLPRRLKVRDGVGKWVLRQVLSRYVPDALVDRPKAGFSVPLAAWLRGPLRDWAEDLLANRHAGIDGLIDGSLISDRWRQHLSGQRDWHAHLWTILMLEAWLREEKPIMSNPQAYVPACAAGYAVAQSAAQ